jgi:hypothetical protein
LLQDLKAFGSKADKLKWRANTAFEDDRRAFILRPSALSYRFPDPIIPPDLGHERLFGCPNETNKFALGNYLKKRHGVTDVATLFKALKLYHGSHDKFDWFRAYRVGRMSFDLTDFNGDSGWRFTAVGESEDCLNDPKNVGDYDLNMICNFDPDIVGFLTLETGSVSRRFNGGPLMQAFL